MSRDTWPNISYEGEHENWIRHDPTADCEKRVAHHVSECDFYRLRLKPKRRAARHPREEERT